MRRPEQFAVLVCQVIPALYGRNNYNRIYSIGDVTVNNNKLSTHH